jgi:hypothetical protein
VTGLFILFGGIALFVAIMLLFDWLGRRKQRQSQQGPAH